MHKSFGPIAGAALIFQLTQLTGLAWDYEGHRAVNLIALASLPTNFPAFVRAAAVQERIAFLSCEADRWRNTPDLPLRHFNGPDHYIDIEELSHYWLEPMALPQLRYDFVAHLALARKAHPERFPPIDEAKNKDHTRQLVGLLPWTITEYYGKLKSGFSYLKVFEEDGTPEEVVNAQQNIVYVMGVMGHFVGDASQPLHTTKHHHGWVGDNPQGYTTNYAFHQWIDGDFFEKSGGIDVATLLAKARPARLVEFNGRPAKPEEMFQAVMEYILEAHKLVEPLYQIEKEKKLSLDGKLNREGKEFLNGQLLKAGQMLGDIWYSAWQQTHPDTYLKGRLAKRKLAKEAPRP